MGCGHGRQGKGKLFHRSAPPLRKTITKKNILALSQPPASTPASHRSACRPQQVGASEGIWSQVPWVHIYASGQAEQSSRESGPRHRPKGGVSRDSSQPCLTKLCLFRKLLQLSTTQPNG